MQVIGSSFFFQRALLSDDKKDLEKKFKVGSVHECRVTDFNYVDNMVILTAKE